MERPNSTENRNNGIQASIVGTTWKPNPVGAVALLGDQYEDAVGGADGEQVHDDAGRRYHDPWQLGMRSLRLRAASSTAAGQPTTPGAARPVMTAPHVAAVAGERQSRHTR